MLLLKNPVSWNKLVCQSGTMFLGTKINLSNHQPLPTGCDPEWCATKNKPRNPISFKPNKKIAHPKDPSSTKTPKLYIWPIVFFGNHHLFGGTDQKVSLTKVPLPSHPSWVAPPRRHQIPRLLGTATHHGAKWTEDLRGPADEIYHGYVSLQTHIHVLEQNNYIYIYVLISFLDCLPKIEYIYIYSIYNYIYINIYIYYIEMFPYNCHV